MSVSKLDYQGEHTALKADECRVERALITDYRSMMREMTACLDYKNYDLAIRALLACINVTIDQQIDAQFPARRAARISVTTRSGGVFTHDQHTRKGDPDLPLTDAELDAKFTELTSPVLGTQSTEKLLQDLWRLEQMELLACLAHATRS